MSEREPKTEAVVLARKAEDDANAMRMLGPNPEISDEGEFPLDTPEVVAITEHAVPLRYDEILDTEPLDRMAVQLNAAI